jgi:diguanylate cyclase (GGDEF)-like protein/PAS domain S-box-containing protein
MPDDQFYKSILDHLYDGVYFVDTERRITYWNNGAERISGFGAGQMIGRRCADNLLNHVDSAGRCLCHELCPLLHTMTDGTPREAEVYLHHADGHRVPVLVRAAPLRDAAGNIVGAVESFSDNTRLAAARQRASQLAEAAERDPLTGLGNRAFLLRRLVGRLAELQAGGLGFGLLFADLDHFKEVNDTFGHAAGDEALRMVARTVEANLRASDSACRWGGDELMILVNDVTLEQLAAVANKLRVLVSHSWRAPNGHPLTVTLSAGGTLARPADTPDSVIERADDALYQSKHTGRNCVSLASP